MADAAPATSELAPKKKGLLGRIFVPLLMLLVGAGAGAGGAMFIPTLLPHSDEKKVEKPKVAPLQYVEIDNSFTSNLKDTGRFVQVRIAVSTNGGETVVEAVERHKLAIIAAVLDVLSDTSEAELGAPGGRDKLSRQMRMAINDVLQRKSGIAGVDDVFLTSFVLQ
jgi:flagellar FliL protein